MSRRVPLWITLIPLAIGLAAYWFYWSGERDAFRAQLATVFGADTSMTLGGFPYRLEATVGPIFLRHDGSETFGQVSAEQIVLNRQPWRRQLTIASMRQPRIQLTVPPIGGARLDVEAATSLSSLRRDGERIARLSNVFQDARIWLAILPVPVHAKSFEAHLRETPSDPPAIGTRAPTPPEQAQVVLSGAEVRIGEGDPLTLAAEIGVTDERALASVADWRRGGTVEIKRLTLRDDKTSYVDLNATLAALPNGRLTLSGTIETICPQALRAAFFGRPAPTELRARRPVRFGIRGEIGRLELVEPDLSRVPVRSQEPPCPVLRR